MLSAAGSLYASKIGDRAADPCYSKEKHCDGNQKF